MEVLFVAKVNQSLFLSGRTVDLNVNLMPGVRMSSIHVYLFCQHNMLTKKIHMYTTEWFPYYGK